MKSSSYFYLIPIILTFTSCRNLKENILPYAPTPNEVYPSDTILSSEKTKKAMVIIAHDDDMTAMSGTIAKLNKEGWEIQVLSFHMSNERDNAHKVACSNITDTVIYFDLEYSEWRKDLARRNQEDLYLPIAKEQFGETFNTELVEQELIKRTNNFIPSVIFSLDNRNRSIWSPRARFYQPIGS